MSEPIKHHFIPQFILRNFTNNNDQLLYWNTEERTLELRNTRSVYMVKNLYRDDQNHPTDPVLIEKKFSQLESTIASLFNSKIINEEVIRLTRSENENLRKFLFLLSFRSQYRKQQYIDGRFDEMTKAHLEKYTINNDYVDLWLREIEMILDLDDYHKLQENEKISWTIKTDFATHLFGYYMTFITPRSRDFLMCDIYPTAEIFPLGEHGANLFAHYIYPITPQLALLLNHIAFRPDAPKDIPIVNQMVKRSNIKGASIIPPKSIYINKGQMTKDDLFEYKVNKIYPPEVDYINILMLNEANKGFSFMNFERIVNSINIYQSLPSQNVFVKNDYTELIHHYNESV